MHMHIHMYIPTYTFGLRFVSRSMKVKTITEYQAFIMNSEERGSQTSQKKRASDY